MARGIVGVPGNDNQRLPRLILGDRRIAELRGIVNGRLRAEEAQLPLNVPGRDACVSCATARVGSTSGRR